MRRTMPIKRHGVVLLGPNAGEDPPFIGAKCRSAGVHEVQEVQENFDS